MILLRAAGMLVPGESGYWLTVSSWKLLRLVGDLTAGDPPVPIPNTEVKPRRADCTARESVWESRSSPALIQRPRSAMSVAFSLCAEHVRRHGDASPLSNLVEVKGLEVEPCSSAFPTRSAFHDCWMCS